MDLWVFSYPKVFYYLLEKFVKLTCESNKNPSYLKVKTKEISFLIRYIITENDRSNLDKGMCGKDAKKYRTKTNIIDFIISIESKRYDS